ncbi:rolling circle replication-associated protein [Methylobacterium iners]|uniref:Replication-associated protein ORF2/G2P domain-containing protein n=1 Tax=Methylobacterium iners TaxID=418707 RepID=A0ABQ4RQV5_9HYPH|nr:hypothetical protein [Methylobacterium iners]GJD93129.1 hypothetical protein OCOJLMKI_0319 [Methylobacterium iners]
MQKFQTLPLSNLSVRPWAELEAKVAENAAAKRAFVESWQRVLKKAGVRVPSLGSIKVMPVEMDDEEDPRRAFFDRVEGLGEKLRFLREHGLEPEDIGRRNWVGAGSTAPEVARHQAVFGRNAREHGRAVGSWNLTAALTTKQFRQGYEGIALSNCFGGVLNTFLSITWSRVGITEPAAVAEAHQRYLELLRKACRKHGKPYGLVWVIENGRRHGLHSHILMVMPKADKQWLRRQVELAVQTISGRNVHWRLGTRAARLLHRWDRDVTAQWRLFQYMMKGLVAPKERRLIDPERSAVPLAVQKAARLKLKSQGLVTTKRFGVSRNLDRKNVAAIRAQYGITPSALTCGETDPHVLFSTEYLDAWDEVTRPQREAAARAEHERLQTELLTTLCI